MRTPSHGSYYPPHTDAWQYDGALDAPSSEEEIRSRLRELHSVQQNLHLENQRFLFYLIDKGGAVTGQREDAYALLELNLQGESLLATKLYLYEYAGWAHFSFTDEEGLSIDFNHSPAELGAILGEDPEISQTQYDLLCYRYPSSGVTAYASGDFLLELDCSSWWRCSWDPKMEAPSSTSSDGGPVISYDVEGRPVTLFSEWERSFAAVHPLEQDGGTICQLFARE